MPPIEIPPLINATGRGSSLFNDTLCTDRNGNHSLDIFCIVDNSSLLSQSGGQGDPNFWYLLLLIFPVFTLFGNLLVVLSVVREKSLQNATNYFIVSLAVADISLAVLIMPLSIWVIVNHGYWGYSAIFCDIFLMLDVMFCTASILNLVAISLDRFVAVTSPISYSKHSNFMRVYLTIALTWVLSFGIALPIACGLNYTKHRIDYTCEFTNSDYMLYSNLGSFYIPAVVMLILYYKIFRVIKQRAHRAAKTRQGHTYTNCNTQTTQMASTGKTGVERPLLTAVDTRITTTSFITNNVVNGKKIIPANGDVTGALDDSFSTAQASTSSANTHPNSIEANCVVKNPCCDDNRRRESPVGFENSSKSNKLPPLATGEILDEPQFSNMEEFRRHLKERIKRARRGSKYRPPRQHKRCHRRKTRSSSAGKKGCCCCCVRIGQLEAGCCLSIGGCAAGLMRLRLRLSNLRHNNKTKEKEKSAARQEKKATKTLAIVLGVFLFCWVPFFSASLTTSVCLKFPTIESSYVCGIPGQIMGLCVWLGYINSFLNPIIYTIFNFEFRRAFKSLLHIK